MTGKRDEGPFDPDAVTPVESVRPHRHSPNPPVLLMPMTAMRRQEVFGKFAWAPDPIEGNKERIKITDDWEVKNVVNVVVPQLKSLGIHPTIRFHRLGVKQLLGLFAAWESAGLLNRIVTWDGSYARRMKRGRAGGGVGDLSAHAWASAFDINARFNPLGAEPAKVGDKGCVRELVPIAEKLGIWWGGNFKTRPDGMHFEICKLVAGAGA